MAEIKINLSQKDIKAAILNIKKLKDNFGSINEKVLEDIEQEGLNAINSSLSGSNFEFSEPVSAFGNRQDNKVEIGIRGNQAIYEEYGTGTIGMNNPHPDKPSSLNPYNSGKTIRSNEKSTSQASANGIPVSGLYWTYKYNGQKIYTQGRPAGAHVYKASQTIKQNIKEIFKRRVGEELSKL